MKSINKNNVKFAQENFQKFLKASIKILHKPQSQTLWSVLKLSKYRLNEKE